MPQVSIIIPTYNRGVLISETVESVLQQSFHDWECLIIDDHSSDNTQEIVNAFTLKDKRVRYYLNQHSKGAQGARNTGIEKSQSNFLIFLDSDDLLDPNCMLNRLKFASENPAFDYYCFATGVFEVKPHDTPYLWNYLNNSEKDDLLRFLKLDMPWHTSGVLWKNKALIDLEGWDESLNCWQDWDIHIRALLNKNLRYLKAKNKDIDNFYRQLNTHDAISKNELSERSIKSKIYLVNKFSIDLPAISKEIELEFTRVIYHIAKQIVEAGRKEEAAKFFKKYLFYVSSSKQYARCWYVYFICRYYLKGTIFLKKAARVIPYIYKNRSLLEIKRTHLKATI
jgi:glycosyltransferase involved in cell wall biosynthesis